MEELHILKGLNKHNSAFLCGNGFSINFDRTFSNIYDNLFSSHKDVIHNSVYDIKSNNPAFRRKFKDNYKSLSQYLRYITENEFYNIFEDAILFAQTLIDNESLINELRENGVISNLTFGFSEYDVLKQICERYDDGGIQYINIEHWTILIYFYFGIVKLNPASYELPMDNSFTTALSLGNKNRVSFNDGDFRKSQLYEDVIFNGFSTYFRMLFSITIFSNGKAIDMNKLDNLDNLDLSKIQCFLNKFGTLITLNFDNILENVARKKVEKLHGGFVLNKREYVYHQSLGINYKEDYISFSDLLLGDYFTFKTFLPNVNSMSSKKNTLNKQTKNISDRINRIIRDNSISNLFIFGFSIENDYHILRNMMFGFYLSNIRNPHIIYSYFNEEEKMYFKSEFRKLITFSEEVNEYCSRIKISFVSTKEILTKFFYK